MSAVPRRRLGGGDRVDRSAEVPTLRREKNHKGEWCCAAAEDKKARGASHLSADRSSYNRQDSTESLGKTLLQNVNLTRDAGDNEAMDTALVACMYTQEATR